MKFFRLILPLCLLPAIPASAVEYNQLQVGESSVAFGYRQMGVPMEGRFARFSAQLSFDPVRIAAAQARIQVNLASIDTGSLDANDEIQGKKWFNTKTYPEAVFVSSGLKSLGGNRYQASGKLSLKGKTFDVLAPVTFQSSGNRGVFDGAFNIKRLDYAIGEGEWTDVATVADEVRIRFHLVVNAVAAKK